MQKKQCLTALPKGSVGQCAVLLRPLAGVEGAAVVRRSFFYLSRRGTARPLKNNPVGMIPCP